MKSNFSIGVDAVEIKRFNSKNALFIKKILVKSELIYFENLANDESKQVFLAKIWALKESIYKANNALMMNKIEIELSTNGNINCLDHPEITLSLTYCNGMVIAFALNQLK